MAISSPYLDEKPPILFYKNKDYPQRAKGISFFVLIFSIFIYISIFYIFNLSPSLNNTKLWFFVSNTLILIIAADYGVFSSSSRARNDVYDEYYAIYGQLRSTTASSFASQYPQIIRKSVPTEEEDVAINPPDEKAAINDQTDDHPDDKMVSFVESEAENKFPNAENFPEKTLEGDKRVDNNNNNEAVENEKKLKETKTFRRSKSEKPKRVVIDESKNINIRRSASESEREEGEGQEDDEYSTMSDEELNRRIEDFIQRFNRQIRLQRARKFHQI